MTAGDLARRAGSVERTRARAVAESLSAVAALASAVSVLPPHRADAPKSASRRFFGWTGYTTGWNLIDGREEDLALPNVLAAGARNRLRRMFLCHGLPTDRTLSAPHIWNP